MPLNNDQMAELVCDLQGTCQSLEEALAKDGFTEDDMSQANHEELDNQLFCCVSCGWWCELCEEAEGCSEPTCTDCKAPDEEEEE